MEAFPRKTCQFAEIRSLFKQAPCFRVGAGGRSLLTRENKKMMLLQRYLSLQDCSQGLIMELNSKRSVRIMPLEITREKYIYI